MITGSLLLQRVGANHARERVTVNQLIAKYLRQQLPFVNDDARWRTRAGMQQIWNDAWIVLMPFIKNLHIFRGSFGFRLLPCSGPSGSSHLVTIPVVAVLHDIIDPHATISIIVIVRLPHCPEGINGDLVVVAE